jgi:hypothetical protein
LAFGVAFPVASFSLGHAVLLWRDSSRLYRNRFDRRIWRRAKGTERGRPIAPAAAGLSS